MYLWKKSCEGVEKLLQNDRQIKSFERITFQPAI